MSTADLLRALAARPGSAQTDRSDPRLDPAHAPLDERDTAALLAAARALAAQLVYPQADPLEPEGHWGGFFPAGETAELARLVQRSDGELPPHLALLITFLRLGSHAQRLLNGFTAGQLQFQMQQVLGFVPRPPQPDRAHLVVELKKGHSGVELRPEHRFSAGKDARRVEQLYAPVRPTWIGRAAVARLASLHRGADQRLRLAPVADSADGFGAAFAVPGSSWPPFGHSALPEAAVGFALASPLLRLAEGRREITVTLELQDRAATLSAPALAASLRAHLSGPQGWIGPLPVSAALQSTQQGLQCRLGCTLGSELPAVVDIDGKRFTQRFPTGAPVLQFTLAAGATLPFGAFDSVEIRAATLEVTVDGLRGLVLSNDQGALDARRAFLPFGAEPVVGSRLLIGCPEALGKPLHRLLLNLRWQGAPEHLGSWYSGYRDQARVANGIAARLDWLGPQGEPQQLAVTDLMQRSGGVTQLQPLARLPTPANRNGDRGRLLRDSGLRGLAQQARRELWHLPQVRAGGGATRPAASPGSLSLTLEDDFLHGAYRHESVERLMAIARGETVPGTEQILAPLRAPYTPKAQEIWLDYSARSARVALDEASPTSFEAAQLQFFHVDALGVSREHPWLLLQREHAAARTTVGLLPGHTQAGSWWIGLTGVTGGDSLSLLVQVAEGSADPQAQPQRVSWAVLVDNAWRELLPGELLDGTDGLRRSGLVQIALPTGADTQATRCDTDAVWLRASLAAEPQAVCEILAVHANAVEVEFIDQGNDPLRLAQPLAAGSIGKLTTALPAVKGVSQPYPSFGGALQEGDTALARRAAERLRHRGRAITAWDAERLVLQAFPSVYRAKCLPHARPGSWQAAGHAMLLVLPDLRRSPARDRLQPRVDLDTLARIGALLRERGGLQLQWHVCNPRWRRVQLEFKLRLRPGWAWNPQVAALQEALVTQLSPWAAGGQGHATGEPAGSMPELGVRILRSALLAFIEARPEVDHVTDFHLWLEGAPGSAATDVAEALPEAPDIILVSAPAHRIVELTADV
jgi:hypothetical protein